MSSIPAGSHNGLRNYFLGLFYWSGYGRGYGKYRDLRVFGYRNFLEAAFEGHPGLPKFYDAVIYFSQRSFSESFNSTSSLVSACLVMVSFAVALRY